MADEPDWVQDALNETGTRGLSLLDMMMELCHFFGWTEEYVLDMPVQMFWDRIEWLAERRKREAEASKGDPVSEARRHMSERDL